MKKINLLYIIQSLENGGAEMLAIRLAERLDRNRFNAGVCSLSSAGPLRRIVEEKGVPLFSLGKRAGTDPFLVAKLHRLFGRLEIDIAHTHNLGPLLYARPAAFLNRRVRLVHTEHIDVGKELSYSRKARWLSTFWCRGIDGFVSIAKHLTERFCEEHRLYGAKVATIPNSVELPDLTTGAKPFLRRELGISDAAPLVGSISALRGQKDHATLLRAMQVVVEKIPEAVLVIAGDGELKAELAARAQELGLNGHVRFLGFRTDVTGLLREFDLFVLSSRYEGLPLCILEAMASGKPVAATDAEGTNEVVRHGQTGLLTPPGDHRALAESILSVLSDPARASAMGASARKRIGEEFNMDRMIGRYEAYYSELLAGDRARM